MQIRKAVTIAATPPTTPPAIAPVSDEELRGLEGALGEMEEMLGVEVGLGKVEGFRSVMLDEDKGKNNDDVELEATLEVEDEVETTMRQ